MAIGDDAAAAGMDLVPSSGATGSAGRVRQGWQQINKTRDYIAQKMNAVLATVWPVNKGGTGATDAGGARSNLKVPFDDTGSTLRFSSPQFDRIALEAGGVAYPHTIAYLTDIPAAPDLSNYATKGELAPGNAAREGYFSTAPYNRAVSGQWRSAVVNSNGDLGYAPSTERMKKNIRLEDVTDEQVLALQLVTFQWRAATDLGDQRETGLIAERLDAAGLGWAVFRDEDGTPAGIHYERVALALIPALQRLMRRVSALEADRATAE